MFISIQTNSTLRKSEVILEAKEVNIFIACKDYCTINDCLGLSSYAVACVK